MKDVKFSVLCSLYYKESPSSLRQSLESIFAQTLLPAEVVMVKDGPLTEELETVLQEFVVRYSALKVVPLLQNVGLGAALNEGLKHCSCELVARMDTDDIAKPNRFEQQVQAFLEHPDVAIVSAWIDEFEGDTSNIISVRKLPETHAEIYEYGKDRCPINHPVVMFKKSAVEAAGSYQPFHLFEDYFLWVRMLMNGAKFYNIQASLLFFRISRDVYKRRSGWKYAKSEARLEKAMFKLGYISFGRMLYNTLMRCSVRIMPHSWVEWVYKKIVRK